MQYTNKKGSFFCHTQNHRFRLYIQYVTNFVLCDFFHNPSFRTWSGIQVEYWNIFYVDPIVKLLGWQRKGCLDYGFQCQGTGMTADEGWIPVSGHWNDRGWVIWFRSWNKFRMTVCVVSGWQLLFLFYLWITTGLQPLAMTKEEGLLRHCLAMTKEAYLFFS